MTNSTHPAARPGATSLAIQPALFLFALAYGGMTVLAGVLGNKQVGLFAIPGWGSLAVEAGIFAFLLLVALSSAVAELYGRPTANRLVLWGFVPLILSMLLIMLVLGIPAASDMDPARLAAFDTILGQSPRLMAAGIVAYGTSQILNVTIFSALRGGEGEGVRRNAWLAARGAIASALSQIVDTLLFIGIAFWGVFPIGQLMAGQMIAKVALSLVLIPLVITGLVALGRSIDSGRWRV